jgi:hypothetical protein
MWKKRNARRGKAFVRKAIPLLKVLLGSFSFKKSCVLSIKTLLPQSALE